MLSASQVLFKYSAPSATQGDTSAQANISTGSLGKYMSSTQWFGGSLHDLFDLITGPENTLLQTDYRCIFIHNTSTTNHFISAKVWIDSQVPGGATVQIGLDPAGPSLHNAATQQAAVIATTTNAPAGVTFSSTPINYNTGLWLGDATFNLLSAGYCQAIWLKRTALNTGPVNNDGCTLGVQGDTSA